MEEEKFPCKLCERIFGNKEALEMHTRAKHSNSERKPKNSEENIKKSSKKWIITVFVFLIIIASIYFFNKSSGYGDVPASEINIRSHSNLAMHIHADLEIIIDNETIEIPPNIGIFPGVMRPLHTHDSSGEIHIEGPYARSFTLGEFFDIWGRTFNESCIFDYCSQSGVGQMEMFVNGEKSESYQNLILRDGQDILIEWHSF